MVIGCVIAVTVGIEMVNRRPVADAGEDQTGVRKGILVTLDGSGSRDADGDTLTYRWTQRGGSLVTLSDTTAIQPTFTPRELGTYVFTVVVNDGQVDSEADEVVVTVHATPTTTVTLPGGTKMEMVWIEPGTFTMGSPSSETGRRENEGPQHEVTISRGFYLGKYELTQGQWTSVMGTHPWSGEICVEEAPDHPAAYISWEDVQALIAKLNEAEGAEVYRLPTEAEWEYACRAGTTTRWSFGDDESQLGEHASYSDNTWNVGEAYAHAVGTKKPNPWGLCDMHGNVYEWVQNWYWLYWGDAQTDPTGPATGSSRVLRGGGFVSGARSVRSAVRDGSSPGFRYYAFGARFLRQGP